MSIWWLVAFAGAATVVTGAALPYYRFMNASAAPMALVGLGAFVAIRWFASDRPASKVATWAGAALIAWVAIAYVLKDSLSENAPVWVFALMGLLGVLVLIRGLAPSAMPRILAAGLAALLVFGSLGWLLFDGVQNRWVSEANQWANQSVRTSLAAVNEVVAEAGDAPERADRELRRPRRTVRHEHRVRVGQDLHERLPHRTARRGDRTLDHLLRHARQLPGGRTDDVHARGARATTTPSIAHWCETFGGPKETCDPDDKKPDDFQPRFDQFPEDPVVFLVGQYYGGLCNGVEDCSADTQQQLLDEATAQGVEVGPDVYVIEGDGLWTPPANVVADAQAAAAAEAQKFESHPGALDNLPQNLLVVLLLALLLIVPGLARVRTGSASGSTPDRIALIPGMSVIFLILSGIGVLAVWRGPLSVTKGWTVVAVAVGVGAALRFADAWLRRPLESFGDFFNGLFGVFSNRDFAVLMGVQFLVQAGQGVDPGRDRQVDRVRRQGRLRHPERAVGGLPAQGGAGAVRAVHAALAVHRRVHRPVRASSCRVVDQPHHVGDRRCDRHRRARAARRRHDRGQGRFRRSA